MSQSIHLFEFDDSQFDEHSTQMRSSSRQGDCSNLFSSSQLAEQVFYIAFQLSLQRGGADHQQMRQVGFYCWE